MLGPRARRRLLLRAGLAGLLAILSLASIGLVIASILLAFLFLASPAVATLLTALCVAGVCGLLLLLLASDRRRHGDMLGDVTLLLPMVLNVVKQRPLTALGTALALALGLAAEMLHGDKSASRQRRS